MSLLYFLIILAFVLLLFGMVLIISSIFKFETIKSDIVMQKLAKKQGKTDRMEVILYSVARRISKLVKLNPYKRQSLAQSLKEANIPLTPEAYIVKSILVSSMLWLLIIPFLYIYPLFAVLFFILAIWLYFHQISELNNMAKKKREKIELALPRFTSTIAQQLKYTKNIVAIFEAYRKYAEGEFADEIDITLADMRTGQLERALLRFETRINSSMLSEIVRGLIGVVRGDDNIVYFELLAHNFKTQEVQRLKAIAVKRPSKMRRFSYAIMVVVVITYLVIMFMQLSVDLSKLF